MASISIQSIFEPNKTDHFVANQEEKLELRSSNVNLARWCSHLQMIRNDKKLSHYITLHYIASDGQFRVVRNSLLFLLLFEILPVAWLGVGVGSYMRVAEVSPGIITFSWYSLWATLQHSNTPTLQHSIVSGQNSEGLTCQASWWLSGSLSFN